MFSLYNNNLLSDKQFGFTPKRSTEDTVFTVVEWVKNTFQQQMIGVLISLDISGTFDNAWCPKLLCQLKALNCPKNS